MARAALFLAALLFVAMVVAPVAKAAESADAPAAVAPESESSPADAPAEGPGGPAAAPGPEGIDGLSDSDDDSSN